jgi:hypothetical protein
MSARPPHTYDRLPFPLPIAIAHTPTRLSLTLPSPTRFVSFLAFPRFFSRQSFDLHSTVIGSPQRGSCHLEAVEFKTRHGA